MEKKIKSFDGTQINYDISKKESDSYLVFIHGVGGDLAAWKKERNLFHKKGYSTIAIDLRGHGKSGRPKLLKDYNLKFFARDIQTVLKHEKIKDFSIVGHCFGGMVTMIFHKLYPKKAKRISQAFHKPSNGQQPTTEYFKKLPD